MKPFGYLGSQSKSINFGNNIWLIKDYTTCMTDNVCESFAKISAVPQKLPIFTLPIII